MRAKTDHAAALVAYVRSPHRFDPDVVAASMAASHREAAKRLHALLEPLIAAGADKALMADLLAACSQAAHTQLIAEILQAVANSARPAPSIVHPFSAVH